MGLLKFIVGTFLCLAYVLTFGMASLRCTLPGGEKIEFKGWME